MTRSLYLDKFGRSLKTLEPRVNIILIVARSLYVHADPYEDQFEKRDSKRKEGIAKNEYQRLRNIGKSLKGGRVKGEH